MASAKDATAPNESLSNDDIGLDRRLELFRLQVEIRDCEKRAFDLFLQNLIKGTSHLSIGKEAVAAGFGVAMRKGDKSFCIYRGHAHTLARGAAMAGRISARFTRRSTSPPSGSCRSSSCARTISIWSIRQSVR